MPNTFRVTTYELSAIAFSGTTINLSLNQNLVSNYFCIIMGGADGDTSRGPGDNHCRVIADPFGTGSLSVSSDSDILRLERASSSGDWVGTITVVECLGDESVSGFTLVDVVELTMSTTGATTVSGNPASSWSDINQVIPFGGLRGGGVTGTSSSTTSAANPAVHGRLTLSDGPQTVTWTRDQTGATAATAVMTVYIVEWGSDWNIQHVQVSGSAGGGGAGSTSHYNTAAISEVTRANTFVWGCGYTDDGGIGDSFGGTLVTLGDGVNQNASETSVAVGQEYADNRVVEVYVAENPNLTVQYIFKADGNTNDNVINNTSNSSLGPETYPGSSASSLYSGILAMPSMDGTDGGWPCFWGTDPLAGGIASMVVDEDTITDSERNHTDEEVAYLIFGGLASGNIQNDSSTIIGEFGTVSNVDANGVTLNYINSYTDPVVLVTSNLQSGDPPATPRAYSIGSSSCTVRFDLAATSGTPSTRDCYYVILEAGAHTLYNGTACEAGVLSNFSGLNGNGAWDTTEMTQLSPTNSYSTPVVLGGVQTDNDSNFQAFWANGGDSATNPSSSAIWIGRQIAQDSVNTTRAAEDLGYIIWEAGQGFVNESERNFYANYTSDIVQGPDDSPPYDNIITASAGTSITLGYRFGLQYNGCNGTGTAYPRPYFGVRHSSDTNIKTFRGYNGQSFPAWIQSIDMYSIEYSSSSRRVAVCS